jgi:hypothetical protein
VFIYLDRIAGLCLPKKCLSDIGETRSKTGKAAEITANCSPAQDNCSAMNSSASILRWGGAFFTKANILVFRCLPAAKYLEREYKRIP